MEFFKTKVRNNFKFILPQIHTELFFIEIKIRFPTFFHFQYGERKME